MKNLVQTTLLLAGWLLTSFGASAQDPVANYDFAGQADDQSGYDNHASINGAQLTADRFGRPGYAFVFDGVQSAIRAPNQSYLNSANATISFWVNPAEFPAQGEAFLLSFGGWQQRWKISLPNHGKPVFTTHSGGQCCSDMDSGTPLTVGTWTHVVMVHDGTKDIIYFNGAKANEKNVAGALDATTHPLGIGFDPIDNANYFKGSLDEVRLYDVALTDAQITALYTAQNTAPGVFSNIAAYGFNGNGTDGSYFNHANVQTAAFGTDRFGFGKSALVCNGTSSEVTAANSSLLNSAATTVSFWVKPNSLPGNGEAFLLSYGGWQERWKISLPPHGKPVWTTNHSGGISDMDSGDGNTLVPGQWKHVVMVHDGTKDLIYFNGAKVAEKNVVGTLNSTTKPLGFGWNPIDGGNWFDGSLDDVLLYNKALTDAEIANLYTDQSDSPADNNPLVAQYNLNGKGTDGSQFHNSAQLDAAATATENRHGWPSNAIAGAATADNSIALQSDYTTIMFWVKPNAFPGSGEVFLLSNGGWQERWKISLPAHGKPVFTTHSGGQCCSDMDSGTPLTVGTWTHVTMVHDGTKDIIYFNGAKANEKNVAGALDKTKHPLGIGYDPIDKSGYFDGALDDVKIFNKALTDAEILAAYNSENPAPVVTSNLVADYQFISNGDDASEYGNHIKTLNAAFAKDRFGKSSRAVQLNGTTSEVTAANAPQLNTPATTVSFWAKPNALPAGGEAFLLSFGGWQERWKISLPQHGKPVWTTNHSGGISDMDSGDGNTLVPGQWKHVVMVHDGTHDKIYMNGVKVAEKSVSGTLNSTTKPLGIGWNPIDGGNVFDGSLDEVQVYKTALNDVEIADLYQQQNASPPDTGGPPSPLNLTAKVTFTDVQLNWLPPTYNYDVVGYVVYQDGQWIASTGSTSLNVNGLAPLTDFVFGVTAIDSFGNESRPTTLKVRSGEDQTPDVTPPTAPGNLNGTAASNSVLLGWTASTDDREVAGYIVWVDGVVFDTLPANALSVFISGLEAQTLYTFEVAAFDKAGNLSEKAEITISTKAPIDTGEPGMVAWYPFDGNANDATPYQNHGAIGGNPVFETPTHPNGGSQNIKFDGQQDSVLAPNAAQLISDYATVAFWIRVDDQNLADAEAYVLDFGHWSSRWKISLPQHLKIVWTTNSNNTQFPNFISDMDSGDGNELVKGFWWYVTMTHDGTEDRVYVNGQLANSKPALGKLNSTSFPLGFGNNPIEGGQYFIGALDEVKIYNKSLTAAEIEHLYNTGTTSAKEANLLKSVVLGIAPNPTTDVLHVRHAFAGNQALLVRVFDLAGRQIDQLRFDQNELPAGQFSLKTGKYPAGNYSLNFVYGGKNLGSLPFSKQ